MSASAVAASTVPHRRGGGTLAAYRAERRKLTAQLATRVLALVCGLAPFAFGLVLSLQSGVPGDTLLGVWVHDSGYAMAFVILGFCGYLGFPVLAGVLAGDVFSSEDRYDTWKSLLTRSRTRREVFAGKCLAISVLATELLLLATVASLLSGLAFSGSRPLVGLDGNLLSTGRSLWLLALAWLVSLPPLLAFTSLAVLFSAASRSGIVGVLGPLLAGLVMQLLALVGTGSWMHAVLITTAFADWHGLVMRDPFYAPLLIDLGVSALWIVACLGGAWLLVRRRDLAGPPVPRSRGWAAPARAVVAAVAVVVLLGVAGGLGPAAVTHARLEGSIAQVFERLTLLQQRELGHRVPAGTRLDLLADCYRHSGRSVGPGDDWSCTLTLLGPAGNSEAFQTTPVTYDVSVKSEGCYKAQAPPSFVGSQMMTDARGGSVVNPLFSIYGCFDTTAAAHPVSARSRAGREVQPSRSEREAERRELHVAERRAGPRVMREISEAERREQRNSEGPERAEGPEAAVPSRTR